MRFDWLRFCSGHNISYVTAGPNTAKSHISIRCPWCGSADPSQHMGLSLDLRRPAWGCLRDPRHRGVDPARLVARLLAVSEPQARALVVAAATPPTEEFEAAVDALRQENVQPLYRPPAAVQMPRQFHPVCRGAYGVRFVEYLDRERGFGADAVDVAAHYGLYYCLVGDFAWRLLFPITNSGGVLVGWTGRDIRPNATLRYRTSDGMGGMLLQFPAEGRRILVVCEGPLDALKLDWFGREHGVRAVAIMGLGLSRGRMAVVELLRQQTNVMWIAYDADAEARALSDADMLNACVLRLPAGRKDPAEMTPYQVKMLLRSITSCV